MKPERLVVIFALRRERLFFRPHCRQFRRLPAPFPSWACIYAGQPIELIETGVGPDAMEKALAWLFQRADSLPTMILLAGFCGALRPSLKTGSVVPVREIVDEQGQVFSLDCATGYRLLTTPRLIGTVQEKQLLQQKYQADAVDMESSVGAAYCRNKGIPFHCIRAVSDDWRTNLSPALLAILSRGRVNIFRLLAAVLWNPSMVAELWRLTRNTRLAAQNLAGAINQWFTQIDP